jgi:hypothetical protein
MQWIFEADQTEVSGESASADGPAFIELEHRGTDSLIVEAEDTDDLVHVFEQALAKAKELAGA